MLRRNKFFDCLCKKALVQFEALGCMEDRGSLLQVGRKKAETLCKCSMNMCKGNVDLCGALICSDARKCDPQPSSCPPLTAEQRISQIPVCHGIKYSRLKKLGMKMIICITS